MSEKQKSISIARLLVRVMFSIVMIFGGIVAIDRYQEINDWAANLNYTPTAEIANLARKIELTPRAETIFYATRPEVNDADEFNQNCTNRLEQTAILGCYKNDSIYIYSIDNQDLNGIVETTAAHELLHAVWARLRESERDDLKVELETEYQRLKTPELEKTMAGYEITEPGQHENELHSILGTEFRDLSPSLERHYAQYFNDRSVVVAFYENYNRRFTELKQRGEEISAEMQDLRSQIDSGVNQYERDLSLLNNQIAEFNVNARNGFYSSQAQFYIDRGELQAEINRLENYRSDINGQVEYYNLLAEQLNEIAIETNELTQSLSSHLQAPDGL